ncbi:MAG: FAD-binding oxidoreductase [Clostridia bacterium]|nr:FAD-binding oxidoreductase [Clostridia bacterium]
MIAVSIDNLKSIIPAERVLTNSVDLWAYLRDSWPLSAMQCLDGLTDHSFSSQLPQAVVLPKDTKEVQAVMEWAFSCGVAVTPFGGGSGVCGGAIPSPQGIVIDTKLLNQIYELDETSLLLRVGPGCIGQELEEWLNAHGYTLGHFPQSITCSTVGGWVSTRAAGQLSTRYGNIDSLVVGLEVVLPTGEVIRTKERSARSAAGPDLKQLFIGAEGTLGIITEITLLVQPLPAARIPLALAFDHFERGLEALRLMMREGLRPAVARLYDDVETARHFYPDQTTGISKQSFLILTFEGNAKVAQAEAEVARSVGKSLGGIELPEAQDLVRRWLKERNVVKGLPELISAGLIVDTIEVAATWDRVGRLYRETLSAMAKIPGTLAVSAHSSHSYLQGTNLYITFVADPQGQDLSRTELYHRLWAAAMEACLGVGGTISHHHGVGLVRLPWLKRELGSAYTVLTKVKAALDPQGIMNPGKLVAEGTVPREAV